jgi:hypothetical protein
MAYVKDSDTFCIKESISAESYLSTGDLYILCVPTKLRNKKGQIVVKNYPEIALHVQSIPFSGERINPNEIHGNGLNQGIRPEYFRLAKEFILQKKTFANGQENFRFANAQELDTMFSDTEMYNKVEEKVNSMISTGNIDFSKEELKFLYQIYRPVKGFTLNDNMAAQVDFLKRQRFVNISHLKSGQNRHHLTRGQLLDVADEQRRVDYGKMFDCKSEEVFWGGMDVLTNVDYGSIYEQEPSVKVVVGNLTRSVSRPREIPPIEMQSKFLSSIQVVVGNLDVEYVVGFENLKEVAGIKLTEKDHKEIEEMAQKGRVIFPREDDPRLKYIHYN